MEDEYKETEYSKKTLLKWPLMMAVAVFSLSMVVLWAVHMNEMNQKIMLIGGLYALLCFIFLVFQIAAFVRSHVVYDEDVERIKLKVFQVERDVE